MNGPKIPPMKQSAMTQKVAEQEDIISDDIVVDDDEVDIEGSSGKKRQQPCATDVTFGLIPKAASRSCHVSVDKNKIAVVSNLKRQWKQLNNLNQSETASVPSDKPVVEKRDVASRDYISAARLSPKAGGSIKNKVSLQLPTGKTPSNALVRGPVISLASIMSSTSNKTVKKIRVKSGNSSR